ncbi:hypothetical protein, partial [Photobacterium alginatilyticum]
KNIKVTLYTRQFWYGVWCAWLVYCGAPYVGVMHLRAKFINGRRFIVQYHELSGHSFSERLPFGSEDRLVECFLVVFEN